MAKVYQRVNDSECAICFDELVDSVDSNLSVARLSCGHQFCIKCLRKQLHFEARCAICRQPMAHSEPSICNCDKASALHIDKACNLGIILSVDKKKQVVVSQLTKNGVALKNGLRHGDVILAVNTFPCYNAHTTKQLISANKKRVSIYVKNRSKPFWCCKWLRVVLGGF